MASSFVGFLPEVKPRGIRLDFSVNYPNRTEQLKSELVQTLCELDDASAVLIGIRALGNLAAERYITLSNEDERLASLLTHNRGVVRKTAAQNFSEVVSRNADGYPEAVSAYLELLEDHRRETAYWAIVTLGFIANRFSPVVEDWESVLETAVAFGEEFSDYDVETAVDRIRSAAEVR